MLFRLVVLPQRPSTKDDSPISIHLVPIARDEMYERPESARPSQDQMKARDLRSVIQASLRAGRTVAPSLSRVIYWSKLQDALDASNESVSREVYAFAKICLQACGQRLPGMSTRMTASGTSRGAFTVGRSCCAASVGVSLDFSGGKVGRWGSGGSTIGCLQHHWRSLQPVGHWPFCVNALFKNGKSLGPPPEPRGSGSQFKILHPADRGKAPSGLIARCRRRDLDASGSACHPLDPLFICR